MEADDPREMPRADLVRVDMAKLEAKLDIHFATFGAQLTGVSRSIDDQDRRLREQDDKLDKLWDWRNQMEGSMATMRWMFGAAIAVAGLAISLVAAFGFGVIQPR